MLEKRRTEVEILVSLKNKKLINKDRVAKKKKKNFKVCQLTGRSLH